MTRRCNFYLDETTDSNIEKLAQFNNVTRTEILRRSVQEFIENHPVNEIIEKYSDIPNLNLLARVNERFAYTNKTLLDWQIEIASLISEEKFVVIHKARQIGLSHLNAAIAVAYAKENPGSVIVFISPKRQFSQDLRSLVIQYIDGKPVRSNQSHITFENNSKIIFISGSDIADKIRGLNIDLFIMDEFDFFWNPSFVKRSEFFESLGLDQGDNHLEIFLTVIIPLLLSRNTKILMGSSMRPRDTFIPLFKDTCDKFGGKFLTFTIDDVETTINKQRMRDMIGEKNYHCEFLCTYFEEPKPQIDLDNLVWGNQ